jgi:hypothetical protein
MKKSQVAAILFLYHGASALKPPYREIYQTTTTSTAHADITLGDLTCDVGWTLYNGKCVYGPPGLNSFSQRVSFCNTYDAVPFVPESFSDFEQLHSSLDDTNDWTWLGIMASGGNWVKYDGTPATFFNWRASAPSADAGLCASSYPADGPGWYADICDGNSYQIVCVKSATGGVVETPAPTDPPETAAPTDPPATAGVVEPPASVNGGGGGSTAVPVGGELILYQQSINPSTGVESAYQYPTLTFVEADEDIHRAGLVSHFLDCPSSPSLLMFLSP